MLLPLQVPNIKVWAGVRLHDTSDEWLWWHVSRMLSILIAYFGASPYAIGIFVCVCVDCRHPAEKTVVDNIR
jgi:hypothetical protein